MTPKNQKHSENTKFRHFVILLALGDSLWVFFKSDFVVKSMYYLLLFGFITFAIFGFPFQGEN